MSKTDAYAYIYFGVRYDSIFLHSASPAITPTLIETDFFLENGLQRPVIVCPLFSEDSKETARAFLLKQYIPTFLFTRQLARQSNNYAQKKLRASSPILFWDFLFLEIGPDIVITCTQLFLGISKKAAQAISYHTFAPQQLAQSHNGI